MRNGPIWTATLLAMLIVLAACGNDGDANNDDESLDVQNTGVRVTDAWLRPAVLPEGSPTPDPDDHDHDTEHQTGVLSALYMVIDNAGGQAVQLVGIETDVARLVELHETQNQNGLLRMRPVESVDIPAGGTATFEPGSLHAMLIDVSQPLEPGDEVAVTLIFNTGERLELPAVPVQE